MRFLVDSADRAAVFAALEYGFVRGVTTNPTLLRRANMRAGDVPHFVQSIIENGAQEVHLQTYAADAPTMLSEAKQLVSLAPDHVVVKLPATAAGYTIAAQLTRANIRVTLTAVYTLRQVLAAHSVGASYVAVYLGRMQDDGVDALQVVSSMQALLTAQRSSVQILAASIRNVALVEALGSLGVGAATIAPPVLAQMLESPSTAKAAATFGEDAHAIQ